jgi:DNA repair exonuclease SbcCD ATPase subunit
MIKDSSELISRLQELAKKVKSKSLNFESAKSQLALEKSLLSKSKNSLLRVIEAHSIITEVAKQVQQQAHDGIASVVSRCIAAVFDRPYQFKIKFEKKRNRTEAKLVFLDGEHEVVPLKASGGGVADVASFALRLACMALSRPRVRRVLILDEPFKFLNSEVYRERARQLLETLADEMEMQIILVTGLDELRTGTIVEIRK